MRVLKLMFPVTLGLGLINFNLSVDSIFATLISERGAGRDRQGVPHLHAARRACSRSRSRRCSSRRFSRLAARGTSTACAPCRARGTRQMLFLLVPAAALMLVLSEPITRVVYQRGEFDAAQTDLVAEALFFFALSLPFAGREPDPDPHLLQPPAAVAPDPDRARQPGRERRPRRAPLQADGDRRHPALDRDRVAGDDGRAGGRAARADRRPRLARTLDAGTRILAAGALLRGRGARRARGARRPRRRLCSSRPCSWWRPRRPGWPPTPRSCWRRGSRRPARSRRSCGSSSRGCGVGCDRRAYP